MQQPKSFIVCIYRQGARSLTGVVDAYWGTARVLEHERPVDSLATLRHGVSAISRRWKIWLSRTRRNPCLKKIRIQITYGFIYFESVCDLYRSRC